MELENRYKGIRTPHKMKFGVSGCTRECSEAQGKDVGVYLGDNWYKINDYLAAKVLLQVKSSSPTAVPFENVGTGADTRWHICDPGGQIARCANQLRNTRAGLTLCISC